MKSIVTSLALAVAVLFPALHAEEKLPIASLSTVLSDIAQNVGGDHVSIITLVKPGVDPHLFEPSVKDVRTISDARLVLASGLGFESYLGKLQQSLGEGPAFIVVGDSVKPIYVEEEEGGHHHHGEDEDHHAHGEPGEHGKMADPHWWHSISNVEIATRAIRDALIAADPEHAADYKANAATYQKRLAALQKWVKLEIAKLPRDKRILVTSHDALGYFARDYGFEIHPVQGISTREQPSSQKVRNLIDEIKEENVKAIFAENIENPKVLAEITRETGAKLGGQLYADGLGDKEAGTYESMMRHNVRTIVSALQ